MTDKNKKIVKTSIILGVVILVTVIAIIFIKKSGGAPSGFPGGPGGKRGESVVSVKTSVVNPETLRDYIITNGEVESQSAIEIYPSMNGKISDVNVLLGSYVKKGDIIAKVDPSEPGTRYALSPIEAPVSGTILSTPVKTGSKVSTSTAVTTIGDIENLQVTIQVPERYISELKNGLKAEVVLEAYGDTIFNASVSRISPVVDKNSRTKEIILTFDKKDSRLNAGMFAKVKLYTTEYKGEIVVPKDSLVEDEDNSYLYVISEDLTAEKRPVKTGKTVGTEIQILEGLKKGEKIAVEGMLSLTDGSKVNDISAGFNGAGK